jgi:hypothetical protein
MKVQWNTNSKISINWGLSFRLPSGDILRSNYENDRRSFKKAILDKQDDALEYLEKIKSDLVSVKHI